VDIEQRTHEIRWSSKGERALDWTLGYYLRESGRGESRSVGAITTMLEQANDASAVFGEATWRIPQSRWSVTAGARYFRDEVKGRDAAVSSTLTAALDTTFSSWNPRASIAFKPGGSTNLYVSAARGFRSGLIQRINAVVYVQQNPGTTVSLPLSTTPDDIWTYEIGGKSLLMDGRLLLEGALYHNDWSNTPVTIPFIPLVLFGFSNTEGAETQGAEVSLAYAPTGRLTLNLAAGYADSTYRQAVPNTLIQPGTQLIGVPDKQISGSVQYSWPVRSNLTAVLYGGVHYESEQEVAQSPVLLPPAEVTEVNARVGLESPSGWAVYAFCDNLTDEHANVDDIVPATGFAPRLKPRMFGVQLHYDWSR